MHLDSSTITTISRETDAAGRDAYWIGGGKTRWKHRRGREDSDFSAVYEGYISITPLHLDLTNFPLVEQVRNWALEL